MDPHYLHVCLGDLVKVNDPLNRETQRILDAAGRLRNITNPLGQKTLYTPDALDRITQLTDAINGNTAFIYDANSNLLTVTDAKTQQTVYTYSNMNRVGTRKDPLLNTETYSYDNNGNVATVTDRKGHLHQLHLRCRESGDNHPRKRRRWDGHGDHHENLRRQTLDLI